MILIRIRIFAGKMSEAANTLTYKKELKKKRKRRKGDILNGEITKTE